MSFTGAGVIPETTTRCCTLPRCPRGHAHLPPGLLGQPLTLRVGHLHHQIALIKTSELCTAWHFMALTRCRMLCCPGSVTVKQACQFRSPGLLASACIYLNIVEPTPWSHPPFTCHHTSFATDNHAAYTLNKHSRAAPLADRLLQRYHTLRGRFGRKCHYALTGCRNWNELKPSSVSQNYGVCYQPVLVDVGRD
jgi:hypothetical protein